MIIVLILTALTGFFSGVLFMVLLAALLAGCHTAPPPPPARIQDDGLGLVVPLDLAPRRCRTRFQFIRAITHGGAAPRF